MKQFISGLTNKMLRKRKKWENKIDKAIQKIIDKKENLGQKMVKPFPLWITPNGLSMARIWCILPIIFFILTEKKYLGLCFFIFGSLLDLFDGLLARFRKEATELGAKLDALADKILFDTTFIVLWLKYSFSFYSLLFWIIISSESILIFLGAFGKDLVAFKGLKRKIGANNWGKIKFTLYCFGTFFLFRDKPILAQKFLWAGVFFACASIISHAFKDNE